MQLRFVVRVVGLFSFSTMAGCGFSRSDHPDFDACKEDGDCGSGGRCVQGFCVEESRGRPDGGEPGPGSIGTGLTGGKCESSAPEPCYEAEELATEGEGVCRAGERQCVAGVFTQCLGQVLPDDEQTCNGEDDDCDGMTDEFPSPTCPTPMSGACAQGTTTCFEGNLYCQPNEPMDETCNGEDDDCDNEVDEGQEAECYPEGQAGCETDSDGFTSCAGLCATGVTSCDSGMLGCEGATVPIAEACTSGGGRAVDEDCDGKIDEGGCVCVIGTMRECYAGPTGTLGEGACRAGTQTCTGVVWTGDCPGQVMPEPETCENSNADNDCNGTLDDIPGLGDGCIDEDKQGVCRAGTKGCAGGSALVCVTPMPQMELCDQIDQDCDGYPANGFDFNSNATCGNCDTRCDGTVQSCCGGHCVAVASFEEDAQNCGACGMRCGTGQFCCQGECTNGPSNGGPGILGGSQIIVPPPDENICSCGQDCGDLSCCYTSCVDLGSDPKNCGGCGNDCTAGGAADIQCIQGQCR